LDVPFKGDGTAIGECMVRTKAEDNESLMDHLNTLEGNKQDH